MYQKDQINPILDNYTLQFKILSQKQILILDKHFQHSICFTKQELKKISKQTKIPVNRIIEYLEQKKRQQKSIWLNFYASASHQIEKINLAVDYAMLNYNRKKEGVIKEKNEDKIEEIFYSDRF